MIFENIQTFPIWISILLILFVVYFFVIYIKNNKNIFPLIFLAFSVGFLIIGLLSPRFWNYDKNIEVNWWNILFVMDVSKSMNVFDIKYWNNQISRLQAQKLAINEYIENNIQNNFSLFAFAWETLELLPFTSDVWLFQTIVNWVDQNNISKYGSDFEWLFQIISQYIEKEENSGTVVIFTDWWEIENIKLNQSLINKINKYNSKIIIVWIWTNDWGYIIDGNDIFWRPTYKIYNNQKVISQINSSWINKISQKYDFEYTYIHSSKDFKNLENIINPLIKKQNFEKNISLSRDISYIFIIFFIIFFSLFLIIENKIRIN